MIGRIVSDGDPTGFVIPILKNKNGSCFLIPLFSARKSRNFIFFPGLFHG